MKTVKVELFAPGITGLGKIPQRLYVERNKIPAINRGVLKGLKGINVVRVHESRIIQVAGFNLTDGLYCYLTKPDGTLARTF